MAAASLVAHLAILLAIFPAPAYAPASFEPDPIPVSLVEAPREAQVPKPPTPDPKPAKPPPPRNLARPKPAPPTDAPLPAPEAPVSTSESPIPSAELSDGQLAQAVAAGSGPSGGACDVARRLQESLRANPRVQAAIARSPASRSRAVILWNDEWIRTPGQEGDGHAIIREAILMELLSAPQACRAEAMHGLVLISPSAAPGSTRLALGTDAWRWSDLMVPRRR